MPQVSPVTEPSVTVDWSRRGVVRYRNDDGWCAHSIAAGPQPACGEIFEVTYWPAPAPRPQTPELTLEDLGL